MAGNQGMDVDTPALFEHQKMETKNNRQNFYSLLKQISQQIPLDSIRPYFANGFNESDNIRFKHYYPSSYAFLIDLYKLQLIHPQNVDFIYQYSDYINDTHIAYILTSYYEAVGGKRPLLIRAKFNISSDKQMTCPQSIEPYSPPQTAPYKVPENQPNLVEEVPKPPDSPVRQKHPGMPIYPVQLNGTRGICVVINNEKFGSSEFSERKGSSSDKVKLVETFSKLRYQVFAYDDMISSQMIACLTQLSTWDHSSYDSFVCCILTHGREDLIYGTDGEKIEVRKVCDIFQVAKCSTLAAKPKMFFIQACRGAEKDPGTEGFVDGEVEYNIPEARNLPLNSDFLMAYGTVHGFVSWRHPEQGTWFINVLCHLLLENYDKEHIMNIMTLVNNDLSMKKTSKGLKQIAAPVNHLRGNFYFHPPPNIKVKPM